MKYPVHILAQTMIESYGWRHGGREAVVVALSITMGMPQPKTNLLPLRPSAQDGRYANANLSRQLSIYEIPTSTL